MTEKNIFLKFSNDRAEQFCTITRIVKSLEKKYVIKEAANPLAETHIRSIFQNYSGLKEHYRGSRIKFANSELLKNSVRIDWIAGTSYANYLDELLRNGRTQDCIQSMEQYFEQAFGRNVHPFQAESGAMQYFGTDLPADGTKSVSIVDIDMLFENVIYRDEEQLWIDYDYEWVLFCDVPVKFLIYRCLMYYIRTDTRFVLLDFGVYDYFHITEEERKLFDEMESALQGYISGDTVPMRKLHQKVGGAIADVLPLAEQKIAAQTAQVYYDFGRGFAEQKPDQLLPAESESGKYCVTLLCPAGVKSIRFDPSQSGCMLHICSLEDDKGNRLPYVTNGIHKASNEYLFFNNDPQLIIPVSEEQKFMKIEYSMGIIDVDHMDNMRELEQYCQDMIVREEEALKNQDRLEQQKEKVQKENDVLKENQTRLENEMAGLRSQLNQTMQLYHNLTESTSWKLTAPLRVSGQKRMMRLEQKDRSEREQMKAYYLNKLEKDNYQNWIERLENQDTQYEELDYQPKISVLVPVYNVLNRHLTACIESVLAQNYQNWELCLVDDCSTWSNVKRTLQKYEGNSKIKIAYRSENGHISKCTNSALEIATGEFIAFLDCDDLLVPHALYEVVKKLNEDPTLDFIYSDEDKVSDDGSLRFMPHFKSDWAPDTLMEYMYTCHLGVYRRSIAQEIGGLRVGYEGAQDYDFTLRFTENTTRIAHIPKILYHWRVREESTSGNSEAKPYILEAARKSQEDALARRGLKGETELIPELYQYRVNYLCDSWPKVSVVIPSKDNYEILKTCIESFSRITDYPDYEFVLVDNGSSDENREKYQALAEKYTIQYIYQKEPFNFSHMCNLGSSAAAGEYLLFLNDDIEIIDSKWLRRMVGHASLDHIGAVGAKLLYPDRKSIQHVGVINIGVGPGHALTGRVDDQVYYFGRNRIDYNQIAVTGACLLVKKSKFDEISGFNEELAVGYNDVELCFHLYMKGYYNVVRNDAVLIHHESISRGYDFADKSKLERLMREQAKLYKLYPQFKGWDPFYNKNLSTKNVDFSYNNVENIVINQKIGQLHIVKRDEKAFKVCIDEVICGNELFIKGWFFLEDSLKTNKGEVFIILKGSDDKALYFDVTRKIRCDVVDAWNAMEQPGDHMMETENNVAYNCGFECRIPCSEIQIDEKEYLIGVMVKLPHVRRKITWTSQKVFRKRSV